MEELYHIDMLETDMGLQLRFRRHQASTSSLVKGSSISRVATSPDFKLPKKSAVAWWFSRKKIRKQFPFPFIISKLRVFLFELIHRRISTNRYLFKVGLSSSEQCSFCENTSESFFHLFWECPKTKVFWNEVIKWLCNFFLSLDKKVLPSDKFGFCGWHYSPPPSSRPPNCQILHSVGAKSMHHLPSLELLIRNFLTCLEVERRFSFKNGFLAKFNKKWGAFLAEQEK